MNDLKDELIFILNTKIKTSCCHTRDILKAFPFLNPMLLDRLTHYKSDNIRIDKLMDLMNKVDECANNPDASFGVSINIETKVLVFSYSE